MPFNFSPTQIAALQAKIAETGPERYAEAYGMVLSYIEGQPGVPANVFAWFQGAERINQGEGAFSDFIRACTAAQYENV